jgi:hypothetical protein
VYLWSDRIIGGYYSFNPDVADALGDALKAAAKDALSGF